MMLLALSDPVMIALIALINGVTGGVISIVLAILNRRVEKKADLAASKVEQVRVDLQATDSATAEKLASLAAVTNETHTLVNSNMEVQLKLNAELSRWKADQTGQAKDAEAAEKAEALFKSHQGKQADVDREQT